MLNKEQNSYYAKHSFIESYRDLCILLGSKRTCIHPSESILVYRFS